ncbi:MAG: hypothetical protein DI534_06420 [Leifsonia xyli]|nr:MAG: hypothetical protein DI534_06420 [Leifsonia xyli]
MSTESTPRFALPGKWGRINLRSEASIQRSIRRVLDEVTRRRDDLVEPRAELRRRFQRAAELAKEGGATDFYVAFQLVPTIPLPAWVAVFTPEIESTDFAALGLGELAQFLDQGMQDWGDANAAVHSGTTGPDGQIHAVRHSWRRVADVVEGEVEARFEFVEADYWLAARDPNRIALLTFSTALAEYEDEMLALFDAVVSTLRWPSPVAAEQR